jgi:high-affinity Fe2+/Pb2+ permease
MENLKNCLVTTLTKTIIYDDEANGVYSLCILHNDFDRLMQFINKNYLYSEAQKQHLYETFLADYQHLN